MSDAYLEEQLSFEYLLGRLPEEERIAFEAELMESPTLREDLFASALFVELIREYAVVCSQDSFRKAATR